MVLFHGGVVVAEHRDGLGIRVRKVCPPDGALRAELLREVRLAAGHELLRPDFGDAADAQPLQPLGAAADLEPAAAASSDVPVQFGLHALLLCFREEDRPFQGLVPLLVPLDQEEGSEAGHPLHQLDGVHAGVAPENDAVPGKAERIGSFDAAGREGRSVPGGVPLAGPELGEEGYRAEGGDHGAAAPAPVVDGAGLLLAAAAAVEGRGVDVQRDEFAVAEVDLLECCPCHELDGRFFNVPDGFRDSGQKAHLLAQGLGRDGHADEVAHKGFLMELLCMLEVAALEAEHGCHELRDGAAGNPVLGVSVGRGEEAVKLQKACCRSKDVDDESNADKRRHFELAFDNLHLFYGCILDSSVKYDINFVVLFLAISIICLLYYTLLKCFLRLQGVLYTSHMLSLSKNMKI